MAQETIPVGMMVPIIGGTRKIDFKPTPADCTPAAQIEVGSVDNWEPVRLTGGRGKVVHKTRDILTVRNLGDTPLDIEYTANANPYRLAFPAPAECSNEPGSNAPYMPAAPEYVPEGLPNRIRARIEMKERRRKNSKLPKGIKGLAIRNLSRWSTGVVTVSFKGGDSTLHRKIAETAEEWSRYGNIQFDFGNASPEGPYRAWVQNDQSHIRIGFEDAGYWSVVGNQSMDPTILEQGWISMNFQDFHFQLPQNWEQAVLHEFGHALGFEHEHQSPESLCDFNWPYVYDLYGRTQGWTKQDVDNNMRQLAHDHDELTTSDYDEHSIMHYRFPPEFFVTGRDSPCFVPQNTTLSESDKRMMAVAYPFDRVLDAQGEIVRMNFLREMVMDNDLAPEDKHHYQQHLEYTGKRLAHYVEETCQMAY